MIEPHMVFSPAKAEEERAEARRRAVQDWIGHKAPNLTCPACAQKGYTIKDFVLLHTPNKHGLSDTGTLPILAVAVTCNSCSYLWMFSTESMSLP
jgi:hypothetical protein